MDVAAGVAKKKAAMTKDLNLWNSLLQWFTGCVLEDVGSASGLKKFKCDKENRFKSAKVAEVAE